MKLPAVVLFVLAAACSDSSPPALDRPASERGLVDQRGLETVGLDSSPLDAARLDGPRPERGAPDASAKGFLPDPSFAVSGAFVHGGTVTITRAAGGLGARPRPLPWLWDQVSAQYLDGVDQKAYAGLADGDPITTAVWADQGLYQGWDVPEHKLKYTTAASRLRHARAKAQYGNYAKSASDPKPYSRISGPKWPASWGAQANQQLYLSWWLRMNGATPGYPQDASGNGGEDKPLRFGDTFGAGSGHYDLTVAGLTADTVGFGNLKSWGSLPDPGAAWHRLELFLDRVQGIADLYVNGKLSLGSNSSVNGTNPIEFRPKALYLYASPAVEGTQLDTGAWKNLTVHWLGFDDGGSTQKFAPGRNVEISEVYLDVTRARVELSTAATWVHRPDVVRTSEVQGRLLSWTAGSIQLELNQGAFASLAGLYLWVITDAGEAIRVGRFAP